MGSGKDYSREPAKRRHVQLLAAKTTKLLAAQCQGFANIHKSLHPKGNQKVAGENVPVPLRGPVGLRLDHRTFDKSQQY